MKYANNVNCNIADTVAPTATSILIKAPNPPYQLPPLTGGKVTITDSVGAPSAFEVIEYRTLFDNGDGTYQLNNVLRGQEGTSARSWDPDTVVFQGLTAEQSDSIRRRLMRQRFNYSF